MMCWLFTPLTLPCAFLHSQVPSSLSVAWLIRYRCDKYGKSEAVTLREKKVPTAGDSVNSDMGRQCSRPKKTNKVLVAHSWPLFQFHLIPSELLNIQTPDGEIEEITGLPQPFTVSDAASFTSEFRQPKRPS